MQLDEIRKEIDTVDDEMKSLFIRRMELSRQVALVKARTGDAVRKPDREKAMIARLSEGMDPQLLDVNVHPSKWEVRLSNERQLEDLIRDRLKDALSGSLLVPETSAREARAEYYEPMAFDTNRLIDETRRKQAEKTPDPVMPATRLRGSFMSRT